MRALEVLPLRSPTLPPATHTNCYVLGDERLTLVDPAAVEEGAWSRLEAALDRWKDQGRRVEAVVLTHHHGDHIGAASRLREQLSVPVRAHPRSAELLEGRVEIDELLLEGDTIWAGRDAWEVLHTPGHATGHICLWNPAARELIAGDMVAGEGTIVLDPPEGDLEAYLSSLARLEQLQPLKIWPAHGPPLGPEILVQYQQHRRMRSEQIAQRLHDAGPLTISDLVTRIYPDLPGVVVPVAKRQVLCHLIWLEQQGRVCPASELGSYRSTE